MTRPRTKATGRVRSRRSRCLHPVDVEKPCTFQWNDISPGLVDVGRQIRLPPKIEGGVVRLWRRLKRWIGGFVPEARPTNAPDGSRRHRLRLDAKGLSIGGERLRWIDIDDVSGGDRSIEIFVVPVRKGPRGYSIYRCFKTTYSLEVPVHRVTEIESAIHQFMRRWKPRLKGPFFIMK